MNKDKSNNNLVWVESYTKSDGTNVKGHYRTYPDNIESNNLSYKAKNNENVFIKGGINLNKISDFDYTNVIKKIEQVTLPKMNTMKGAISKLALDFGLFVFGNKQKEAQVLWSIASHGTKKKNEYLMHNGILYDNISSLNMSEYENKIRQKVKSQFKIDDCAGILFYPYSSPSIAIANSDEFQNFVKNNEQKLKNGETVSGSLEFKVHEDNSKTVFGKVKNYTKKEQNLYNAFHYVDILGMKINNQTLEADILDTYDFNKNSQNELVKLGNYAQEAGFLTPYYTITQIKIPLNKIK